MTHKSQLSSKEGTFPETRFKKKIRRGLVDLEKIIIPNTMLVDQDDRHLEAFLAECVNDSLNNSKKNSPQSSTQKDAPTGLSSALDGVLDARMLKNALVAEQLKQQRGFSISPTSGGKRAEANVTLDPKSKALLRKSPSPD